MTAFRKLYILRISDALEPTDHPKRTHSGNPQVVGVTNSREFPDGSRK